MAEASGNANVTTLRPLGRVFPWPSLDDGRRALASRTAQAIVALVHLALCVAFAPLMSETLGATSAFALCLSAAGLVLVVLLRTSAPTAPPIRPATLAEGAVDAPSFTPTPPVRTSAMERQIAGLLAYMNHELRTPLTAIVGFAEMIEQEVHRKGPRAQEIAGHIRKSGAAMIGVADEMITLTAAVAAARVSVPVKVEAAALAHAARTAVLSSAQVREIAITMKLPAGCVLRTEPTATTAALIGLLKVAIACAARRSAITVEGQSNAAHVELIVTLDEVRSDLIDTTGCEGADLSVAALQLTVAHTLLSLQGLHLHTATGLDGRWRAIVEFPAA